MLQRAVRPQERCGFARSAIRAKPPRRAGSGASSAAAEALQVLDTWGTACWVGVGSRIEFDLSEHLFRQVSAIASWAMSSIDMEHCARFVVERGVDVDALFTDRWALSDAQKAYEVFGQQEAGKGAFVPSA